MTATPPASSPLPTDSSIAAPSDAPTASLDALRLESDIRLVRTTLRVMFVTVVVLVIADVMIVGTGAALVPLLALRAVSAVGIVTILWRYARIRTRTIYERDTAVVAWLGVLSVVLMQALRPPGDLVIVRFEMLYIVGMYVVLPNRSSRQAGPAVFLSIAASALLLLRPATVPPVDLLMVPTLLLLANVLGIAAARRRDALHDSETRAWTAERAARLAFEKTTSELRVLRGVLPICAHCRKIRTDVGDWQQLELYVREHSEADFSHGVCPECTAEHYPQVAEIIARRQA